MCTCVSVCLSVYWISNQLFPTANELFFFWEYLYFLSPKMEREGFFFFFFFLAAHKLVGREGDKKLLAGRPGVGAPRSPLS